MHRCTCDGTIAKELILCHNQHTVAYVQAVATRLALVRAAETLSCSRQRSSTGLLFCPAGQQQLAGQHHQLYRGHERVGCLAQPAQQAGAAGCRGGAAAGGGALPEPQRALTPAGDGQKQASLRLQ